MSGLLRLRLAVLGALLVDGSRGALLGLVLADAAVLVRILDVLVLALAFGARSCGHGLVLRVRARIVEERLSPSPGSRGIARVGGVSASARGSRARPRAVTQPSEGRPRNGRPIRARH